MTYFNQRRKNMKQKLQYALNTSETMMEFETVKTPFARDNAN